MAVHCIGLCTTVFSDHEVVPVHNELLELYH